MIKVEEKKIKLKKILTNKRIQFGSQNSIEIRRPNEQDETQKLRTYIQMGRVDLGLIKDFLGVLI